MSTRPIQEGVITSTYGWRTMKGIKFFHTGIDIGVSGNPKGIVVYAAKPGVVSWIEETPNKSGGFGKVVYVKLDDGYYSVYAHLDSIEESLFIGKHIKEAGYIGIMGNTGDSTDIHLHYEERKTMGKGNSREPTDIINLYKQKI